MEKDPDLQRIKAALNEADEKSKDMRRTLLDMLQQLRAPIPASGLFVGPLYEPDHKDPLTVCAEHPIIVLLEVTRQETQKVRESDVKLVGFDRIEDARAFAEPYIDPDKAPAVANYYAFADGRWHLIDYFADDKPND